MYLFDIVFQDFSRFAVPVWLNEPLSFLQRLAEVMQYAELLDKAAAADDPEDRIAYIGAFVVAGLSPNFCRLSKPFNPLLLETFELERDGYRFVAEQVSHHPPISALYAEGENFMMEATVSPRISFGFNKLICHPGATYKVTLKNRQEKYIYEGPTCSIYNVMLGKMYMNIVIFVYSMYKRFRRVMRLSSVRKRVFRCCSTLMRVEDGILRRESFYFSHVLM